MAHVNILSPRGVTCKVLCECRQKGLRLSHDVWFHVKLAGDVVAASTLACALVAVSGSEISHYCLLVDPVHDEHRKARSEMLCLLSDCLTLYCWCQRKLAEAINNQEVSAVICTATNSYHNEQQFRATIQLSFKLICRHVQQNSV